MIVGNNGYLYQRKSKHSRVFVIKYHTNINNSRGMIDVGTVTFPPHCIGKRVRIKIEFVNEEDDENE
jgi:hypothetical protein